MQTLRVHAHCLPVTAPARTRFAAIRVPRPVEENQSKEIRR
jgi:hypothetical protein